MKTKNFLLCPMLKTRRRTLFTSYNFVNGFKPFNSHVQPRAILSKTVAKSPSSGPSQLENVFSFSVKISVIRSRTVDVRCSILRTFWCICDLLLNRHTEKSTCYLRKHILLSKTQANCTYCLHVCL